MDKLSVLYIVLAGVSWGTASVFVNALGVYGFTPAQMSAIRNIVAAVIIMVYVLVKNFRMMKAPLKEIGIFMISGICIFLTNAFYYTSMSLTSASTAVVLMYIAPIIVMIVSVLFMGEKLTKTKLVSVIAAFIGCALVTGIIGGIKFSTAGIVAGVLSGVSYSIYNICAKIEMRRGNDALTATAYCFLTAAVLSVLFSNPAALISIAGVNPAKILSVAVLMGICVGALPYFLYTLGSKKLPASTASAMATIEPLTATVISVVFYKEALDFQAVVGIVMILGSVIALSRSKESV